MTTRKLAAAGGALSAGSYAWRRHQANTRWSPPAGEIVRTSTLAVRVNGTTGNPVMLLHGLVGSSSYWGAAYDTLADAHRLVVPDLLGFGRSPRPPAGYGPDDHVDALLSALDDLEISAPVTVVGHSLGALVALRFAATQPARTRAVVGFGPPMYPDGDVARRHVAGTGPMGRLFVLPGKTAERACRWVCDHRGIATRLAIVTHPSLPAQVAADSVQHTWQSYSETLERVILSAEGTSWLSMVRVDVQLVAGASDPVVALPYVRSLMDAFPNVDVAVWRGKHDVPLTHASAAVKMIEQVA